MKTLKQQEAQTIIDMDRKISELQTMLLSALDRIRELEQQIYGSK